MPPRRTSQARRTTVRGLAIALVAATSLGLAPLAAQATTEEPTEETTTAPATTEPTGSTTEEPTGQPTEEPAGSGGGVLRVEEGRTEIDNADGSVSILIGGTSTTLANADAQVVAIPVPAGTRPSRITGSFEPSAPGAGTVVVSVRGRLLQTLDLAESQRLDIAVGPGDVIDGAIAVSFAYRYGSSLGYCEVISTDSLQLSEIALTVTGTPTVPTTVATFFSASVDNVVIIVPEDADEQTIAAGLGVVAALGYTLPASTNIRLVTGDYTVFQGELATDRVVRLVETDGDSATLIQDNGGLPTLLISGAPASILSASYALSSDLLPLADSGETTGLGQGGLADAPLNHPLSDFGADQLVLSGFGQSQIFLSVPHDQFGGPVDSVDVSLVGTTSAVPESIDAVVAFYWNDFLIDSFILDDQGGSFSRDVTVPVELVEQRNGLRVTLAAAPTGDGGCTGATSGILPVEVHIDSVASSLVGTRGTGDATGFQRFPQALFGALPVAFGTAATPSESAVAAADVVLSLQRSSSLPLSVSVLDLEELVGSSQSGLIVGAGEADADQAGAVLRLTRFRTVVSTGLEFGVGIDQPYGVLQAFDSNSRTLLMLGSWAPEGAEVEGRELAYRAGSFLVDEADDGWFSLSGDLLVVQDQETDPVMFTSNSLVPQESAIAEYGYVGLIVGAIVALLFLLVLIGALVRRRRRQRISRIVDAQQAADAGEIPTRRQLQQQRES